MSPQPRLVRPAHRRIRRVVALLTLGLSAMGGGATPVHAETSVGGTLSGDQVWATSGSPYRMGDNVTLARGATLRIDPGVQVLSSGRFRLNVVGKLQAVGTPADPITLSVGSGLRFYDGSAGSEVAW